MNNLFQDEMEQTAILRIRKFTKKQEEYFKLVMEAYNKLHEADNTRCWATAGRWR